jgi:hypothetical protein
MADMGWYSVIYVDRRANCTIEVILFWVYVKWVTVKFLGIRPGSHVSHFLGRGRSGIVFAVGKTQVYWPHTHMSPSSLRWRTFTWSPQIPPAPQRHRLANASAHYLSNSWVIRTSGFPQTDANSRTYVNECGTVTCVTAASSTEEMTDVWTGPKSAVYISVTLYRGYLIILWLLHWGISYTVFVLVVLTCFVMCGCAYVWVFW